MVQNLHPKLRSYLLFVTKPESVRDLFSLATTVAEKMAEEEQRKRVFAAVKPGSAPRPVASNAALSASSSARANIRGRCWACGASDHLQGNCPSRYAEVVIRRVRGNDLGARQ
jgi:hypothetical protein